MTTKNFMHFCLGLATLASLVLPGLANASIISGTVTTPGGTFVQLVPGAFSPASSPPNTVGADTFNQNSILFGFNENQNIILAAPLAVDDPSGTLPTGTTVASHYIFYDPLSGVIDGTVTFDSPIVAILTSTVTLAASDFLANTGVTYLNPTLRGLEAGDTATFSGNTLTVHLAASSPGDYIRVLTEFSPGAVTPEPASLTIFGAMAVAGAFYGWRRRQINA